MISFLWGTDPHFKDNAPVSRTDDWTESLLEKFRQMAKLAKIHECEAVLLGGDIFDIPTPSMTSHALVQKLCQEFRKFPCPIFSNVGNHDVKYQQLRFLNQSALGTLFSSNVFQRCYDDYEGTFIDLEEQFTVRVVGIPYHGSKYDLKRFSSIKKLGNEKIICLAHLLASPQGGKMFEGEDILPYSIFPELCPDISCLAFGHWHKNQGIVQLDSKQWIVNVGSLSRGSLSEDNIDRIPSVALIQVRSDGITCKEIPLQVKPASEIFDLEKRQRQEEREEKVSKFIETLSVMKERDQTRSSIEDQIHSDSIPMRVRQKANEIWTEVKNR